MTQKFLKDKNFSAATIFFQGKKTNIVEKRFTKIDVAETSV